VRRYAEMTVRAGAGGQPPAAQCAATLGQRHEQDCRAKGAVARRLGGSRLSGAENVRS
jgi:hypothetical protein